MNIRIVQVSDAEIFFAWKNDPLTRANSGITREVTWDEHIAWFTKRAKGEVSSCILTITELDGVPIGTVRSDDHGGVFELSYTVAPEWRGKGLAVPMVRRFAAEYLPGKPLMCKIKKGLVVSEKIAQALGLKVVGEEPSIDEVDKTPNQIWQ